MYQNYQNNQNSASGYSRMYTLDHTALVATAPTMAIALEIAMATKPTKTKTATRYCGHIEENVGKAKPVVSSDVQDGSNILPFLQFSQHF